METILRILPFPVCLCYYWLRQPPWETSFCENNNAVEKKEGRGDRMWVNLFRQSKPVTRYFVPFIWWFKSQFYFTWLIHQPIRVSTGPLIFSIWIHRNASDSSGVTIHPHCTEHQKTQILWYKISKMMYGQISWGRILALHFVTFYHQLWALLRDHTTILWANLVSIVLSHVGTVL